MSRIIPRLKKKKKKKKKKKIIIIIIIRELDTPLQLLEFNIFKMHIVYVVKYFDKICPPSRQSCDYSPLKVSLLYIYIYINEDI